MPQLERPAAKICQGNLILYATSLRVRDLRQVNFYRIDTLDPNQGTGYQRILNETRANRLAEYLLSGHRTLECFLPTSILLATEQSLDFDLKTNTLTIDHREGAFNVVDGQHRIRGLVLAAAREPTLNDFEVPVNIAVNLNPISQMTHFLIVNTTQRAVDKAIEQQIVARLTQMIDFENTPVLPRWIQRQVDKGEDARALAIAQYLNDDPQSAWYGKIRMANEDDAAGEVTINQKSFVTSLKKTVLVPSNPIATDQWTVDKQQRVLGNYWRAIEELLVDADDERSVVFKTNGLHLFHSASSTIFTYLANLKDFRRDTIRKLLGTAFNNLPTESLELADPEFWRRGGKASGLNQAAIRKYATALATAVHSHPDSYNGISI